MKDSNLWCSQVDLLVIRRPRAAGDHLLRVCSRQQRRPVPLPRHGAHQHEAVLKWESNLEQNHVSHILAR